MKSGSSSVPTKQKDSGYMRLLYYSSTATVDCVNTLDFAIIREFPTSENFSFVLCLKALAGNKLFISYPIFGKKSFFVENFKI